MQCNEMYEGFLLLRKPAGISSFKPIHKIRKLTNIQKVGHTGTLDPAASGLLIIAIGKQYTRQIDQFHHLPKTYDGTIVLGLSTDSFDADGSVTQTHLNNRISSQKLTSIMQTFIGSITQEIPAYSAQKHNGKRRYELARSGQAVPKKTKQVTISSIKIQKIQPSHCTHIFCSISCSTGTYIRSIAHEFGQKCGTGAYLKDLCRTQIGPFHLSNAIHYDALSKERLADYLFYQTP